MKNIEEEVPTTNISGGGIANSQNKPLGKIKGKKKLEHDSKSVMLYKRWRTSVDAT